MKYSIVKSALIVLLLFIVSSSAFSHTESETNALIRLMLGSALVRPNFDVQTQSFKTMPRVKTTQQEFFAQDGGWTESEKRAVFDWYLRNLSTTAIDRGFIAGRPWIDNPMALAAISQCEVMSYTNALPIFVANISSNVCDQSRLAAIRIAIAWSPLDENLTGLVESVVTNEAKYAAVERNAAYRHFCTKLKDAGSVSETVGAGVDVMYTRRDDPVGAVAVDSLLVHLRPSYSNSVERGECAIRLLSNEHSSSSCKDYFSNVTNTLYGILR